MADATRIFLSSTSADLAAYRSDVEKLITKYGDLFVGMEHFGARSQPSLDMCLSEVARSDVVILLIGSRYGSLSGNAKSFTQREIEHAHKIGIPIYAHVQENPEPVSETERSRREEFLAWLGHYYTWTRFADSTSLITEVATSLRRYEHGVDVSTDAEAWQHIVRRASAAADWDCLAVTAHNVDQLHSVDLVATDYETRIEGHTVTAGGSGANTIAGLGRVGLRVAVAGLVGDDENGRMIRQALETDGVTTLFASSALAKLPTGTTLAFADRKGRRSIYVNPGANEQFAGAIKGSREYRSALRSAVRSARIVHYSSFTRAPERAIQEDLLKQMPERAILSFTPGALYSKLGVDRLSPLLRRTNVLFLYEQQLDALLDQDSTRRPRTDVALTEKLERLYSWKRRNRYYEPLAVVIKNASASAATDPQKLLVAVGRQTVEVLEPTQACIAGDGEIRDATGAGDAAAAGMLWSILRTEKLSDAVDIAYVFARCASGEYGGRAGLPTLAQLRRRRNAWIGSPQRP